MIARPIQTTNGKDLHDVWVPRQTSRLYTDMMYGLQVEQNYDKKWLLDPFKLPDLPSPVGVRVCVTSGVEGRTTLNHSTFGVMWPTSGKGQQFFDDILTSPGKLLSWMAA